MNAEDFARLYQKISAEEMSRVLEKEITVDWNTLSSKTQEVMLRTAERVLEQVQAPLLNQINQITGDPSNPRMLVSVEATGDIELDAIVMLQSILNKVPTEMGRERVMDYVQSKVNDTIPLPWNINERGSNETPTL